MSQAFTLHHDGDTSRPRLPLAYKEETFSNGPVEIPLHFQTGSTPCVFILALYGGGGTVQDGQRKSCGIETFLIVNGATLAADRDYNYPSYNVTFDATCTAIFRMDPNTTYSGLAIARGYGTEADRVTNIHGRMSGTAIPID